MNKSRNILYILLITFGLAFGCKSTKNAVPIQTNNGSTITTASPERMNALLFASGIKERMAGNNAKAITFFEQALHQKADDHASMYELSELLARENRIDESLVMMKKAIEIAPDNTWYKIRIAQIYKFIGDYEAYSGVYRQLLIQQPDNTEYYGELSSALLLLEKYDEALDVFNQIETQIGVNEALSLQKQQIYNTLDKPEKANAEIEKLAAAFPYEARYQAMLAEIYMKQGQKLKALEAYNKIRELDPNDPYIHVSISEYYRQEGDIEKAYEELLLALANTELDIDTKVQVLVFWFEGAEVNPDLKEKAIGIAEVLIQTHPDSAKGYQILGDVLNDNKEYESANANYLQALQIDSSNYVLWENLLFTDINLQDFVSLEIHSKRCMDLFPVQPLPYLFNGIGCYQNEKYSDALKSFEEGRKFVVSNDNLLGEFYNYSGEVQQKLGNFAASSLAYDKALIINPKNSMVLNNYAYYLSLRGDQLEKALEMAQKATEIDPGNNSNIDTYAWVYYKLGRYEDALRWLDKAINGDDKPSGTIFEHYGDILFKLNRKEEAFMWWQKAKEAGETSEFIDKKLLNKELYE
ncbi:MAG: tetratricopeptide repeat protein [Bacteroidales bacterium]|nr:tetratricopeptide repeat protein [Bacteroidales bacterium]